MTHGTCGRCGESLDGDEIPGLRGRRQDLRIPLELTYKFKGIVVVWRCPFCGHGWPRFDSGPMNDTVVKHLRGEDQARFERAPTGYAPVARKTTPLPEVDPDRKVPRNPGLPRAADQPVPRRGVQRHGARTGAPTTTRPWHQQR